jgi:DNA polymerase
MLDKMLAAIDLDSNQDVLIANVVKCKPPIDRPPSSGESEACLPYLEKQIELVKPRFILLLGAVALKWIDATRREFTMENEAGRFFELQRYPGIRFMVLYHPAFLLRDPRKKRVTWDHLKQLREALAAAGAGTRTGERV